MYNNKYFRNFDLISLHCFLQKLFVGDLRSQKKIDKIFLLLQLYLTWSHSCILRASFKIYFYLNIDAFHSGIAISLPSDHLLFRFYFSLALSRFIRLSIRNIFGFWHQLHFRFQSLFLKSPNFSPFSRIKCLSL